MLTPGDAVRRKDGSKSVKKKKKHGGTAGPDDAAATDDAAAGTMPTADQPSGAASSMFAAVGAASLFGAGGEDSTKSDSRPPSPRDSRRPSNRKLSFNYSAAAGRPSRTPRGVKASLVPTAAGLTQDAGQVQQAQSSSMLQNAKASLVPPAAGSTQDAGQAAASSTGVTGVQVVRIPQHQHAVYEEARLKKAHHAAGREGADIAYELMEAHLASVAKSQELARCEAQVKRGAKGMLKFELMEATQLFAEARDALGPAEDLYQSIISEEAGVRQSLASAESTSLQVANLEQSMAEDAQKQQQRWVRDATRQLEKQREKHAELVQQHAGLEMEIGEAKRDKKLAAQELEAAMKREHQAQDDAQLAASERRRFKMEAHAEEKAAERARRDLKSAQSHSEDVAAKENVISCMIDALEANAEDAGKMVDTEVFEAQQMNRLLHVELSTFDKLEGECERIRREIRDLSRANRSKLLEI